MSKMLTLITKNLFGKKKTRLYPAAPERPAFERSRGRIVFDKENCIMCGICSRKCPADAITVERNNAKWELNAFRCIICGECVASCPKKCLSMSNERRHSSDKKIFETEHVEPPKPAPKMTPAQIAAAKAAVAAKAAAKAAQASDKSPETASK